MQIKFEKCTINFCFENSDIGIKITITNLSDQSCNGGELKKAREGSLNDTSVSLDYIFTEDMKSPECLHILVSCIKNIEAKIKEIWEMNQVTQYNQIKGECQLIDLVKSIEFIMKSLTNLKEIIERKKRKSMNWKKRQGRWIKKLMI